MSKPKHRVYIAGPMTGIPYFNKPAFMKAQRTLEKLGYDPVNPATLHTHTNKPWEFYMRAAITAMLTCDAIYCLKGFSSSRGALLELDLAVNLNLAVTYE